jgi:group I intron endonuclease
MAGFVYIWTNLINGKQYVGSHIGSVDDGYIGSGKVFKYAVKKHGIENFSREILELVENKNNVKLREQHYLNLYGVFENRNFYNMTPHAGGGWDHVNKHPDFNNPEKQKQRSEAAYERSIKRFGGKPGFFTGKKHRKESRQQISDAMSASPLMKRCPINQYDMAGTFIQQFPSIQAAADKINGSPSNIKYTAEGKFTHAYKFIWKYP